MLKMFMLVLVLATLNTLEAFSTLNDAEVKCRNKFNISRAELADLFIIRPQSTDKADSKFKCYFKCVMDELNYKDANGKIDMKSLVNKIRDENQREKALKAITDCEPKFIMETDECERTFKISMCFRNQLAPVDPDQIVEYNCRVKFNVTTREMVELMFELKEDTDGVDRKFKCYTKCLVDDLNYKDENGKIDITRIVNALTQESENPLVARDCEAKYITETDECERIFKICTCVFLARRNTKERV